MYVSAKSFLTVLDYLHPRLLHPSILVKCPLKQLPQAIASHVAIWSRVGILNRFYKAILVSSTCSQHPRLPYSLLFKHTHIHIHGFINISTFYLPLAGNHFLILLFKSNHRSNRYRELQEKQQKQQKQ